MLEFLDQYIPESIKVFLGGDQLTCERIRGGQKARLQSRGRKKLQQFIAKIEDWHALQAYYQVIWEELYSTSSVRDKGTLYQLRTLIDRRNVVSDPKKDLHACQSFLHTVLESTILAVFAAQHSLTTMDIGIEAIFPHGLPESSEGRIQCLTSLASSIVENVHIDSTSVPRSIRDDSTNYTYKLLGMGLLAWDLEDAVREGDGERIVLIWKFLLLLFRQAGKTKYALEAFGLLYNLNVSLTAKQAFRLMHNRTCNVKGRKGENKSLDLQMEHMNRSFKDDISTFSPHVSESTVMKVSRASPTVQRFIDDFDKVMAVRPDSGQHTIPLQDTDRHSILMELIRNKTCLATTGPGTEYSHFKNVPKNIFHKIHQVENWDTLVKWLQSKINEFDYYLDHMQMHTVNK